VSHHHCTLIYPDYMHRAFQLRSTVIARAYCNAF
jgi:hypothetical protein